ncbi:serine hydrolase [Microvirga antarctica]|uniref:serine hydrolase n=1 Tax=Microvirga antarctica TaxID=2819233 RepID=UPI001B311C90|nr:serine hydrolase [Microvirga antarctica]
MATACFAVFGLLAAPAQAQAKNEAAMRARIDALIPAFEAYLKDGMKTARVPGIAIGIVHGDALVYQSAFGVRNAAGSEAVTPETVFQIGSATKAFLSTTLAQAVDAGKLAWTDRVVDRMPAFQLNDPWVGRDFRILDLPAQRSGLSPYVNDGLGLLGFDEETMIRSLRDAPPVGIFRSDFSYLNITHMVAGRILAQVYGVPSWSAVVKTGLLDPLGMGATSWTPEAIEAAPNHATGHRAAASGPVAIPFHASFPYGFGPAGNLNSNVPDMAQWLRLQLGRGMLGEKVLVSEANLDVTWTPRVSMSERVSYAIGWVVTATPNGRVIWHNGGTTGFGAHAGFLPDRDVGLVVLSNLENQGFPDAVAQWFYDRLLGNPEVDNVAQWLTALRAREQEAKDSAPRVSATAVAPGPYLGTYESRLLGEATIRTGPAGLQMVLETSEAVLDLEPTEPDTFSARLSPTAAFAAVAAMTGDDIVTPVQFERDGKGLVTGLRWTSPAIPQTFSRQR